MYDKRARDGYFIQYNILHTCTMHRVQLQESLFPPAAIPGRLNRDPPL